MKLKVMIKMTIRLRRKPARSIEKLATMSQIKNEEDLKKNDVSDTCHYINALNFKFIAASSPFAIKAMLYQCAVYIVV